MGYLAGAYDKDTLKINIVSRNNGYDNIISFMSDLVNAERKEQIATAAKKKAPAAALNDRRTDEGKISRCLIEVEEALYEYAGDLPRQDRDAVVNIVKTSLNGNDKKTVLSDVKDKLYMKFPYIGEFYMELVTPAIEDLYK
jgi:hypothetical protein